MRKSAFLYLVLLFLPCLVQANNDVLRFRVFLKDKTMKTLISPIPALSSASLMRREKQGIVLDSTDYPILDVYLNGIREKGYPIVSQSRWMNTVVVSAPDSTCIPILKSLPFVQSVQLVWVNRSLESSSKSKSTVLTNKFTADSASYYGKAATQIEMLGLESLHQAGFKGSGKTIAVVDAGFSGVDTISWFKEASIIAAKDFIYPPSSVFAGHSHGTTVFSEMATNREYSFVGAAPEASYCLLRSEDPLTEFPIEEDYWAAAVEFADSIGADIVTSSLGYSEFDLPKLSYRKGQLDGKTAFISRAAAIAAQKGLLIVSSAGNNGNLPWKKISFPSDVDQVLTVGSVQSDLTRSSFSSFGPTADQRIKPDVMALGSNAQIIAGDGLLTTGSGTSFSAPLVAGMAACLWQALPDLTATNLLQCIRESGSNALTPDTLYGYGIPNAHKIWLSQKVPFLQADYPTYFCYPNQAMDKLYFVDFSPNQEPMEVILYNLFGRIVLKKTITGNNSFMDISGIPHSIYLVYFLVSGTKKASQKIVIHN